MRNEQGCWLPGADEEFTQWLGEHADGFVLASDRLNYNRVHRAHCADLTSKSHYVRPGSVKVCADSVQALQNWVIGHQDVVKGSLAPCKRCSPDLSDVVAAPQAGPAVHSWLFQGNPDTYDIDGYLAGRERINWTVKQAHLAPSIHIGEEVFIWRAIGSGGDRESSGVIASGVIIEEPRVQPEDPEAVHFWKVPGNVAPALRVAIRVTKVANKREVLKRDWMEDDPALSGLRILRLRNETNYLLSDEQAARLRLLWANTGRDWDREDAIAGLWAYDQTYGGSISKVRGSIVANTALLIGRAVTGVYNKVLNFRALDPRDEREGLNATADIDKVVWNEFFDADAKVLRSDALDDEFRAAWGSGSSSRCSGMYPEGGEAPNDDLAQLRMCARAERRGQPAFRRNLLAAYEGRCCLSGWAPEEVLEAAHIEDHAKTGLNSLGNGLLLRSDLHALFDEGLLQVDPERLVAVLDPSLQTTPYWEFEGRPLRNPVRGDGPRRDLLLERWKDRRERNKVPSLGEQPTTTESGS
jgi:hypothetical protein